MLRLLQGNKDIGWLLAHNNSSHGTWICMDPTTNLDDGWVGGHNKVIELRWAVAHNSRHRTRVHIDPEQIFLESEGSTTTTTRKQWHVNKDWHY